jgi:hypothetical protein
MSSRNKTGQLLEQLLAQLYSQEASGHRIRGDSYLIAQDEQYLGKISADLHDQDSILNQYGPYGSKYSMTSIFNPYSQYGSVYGQFSINNPSTTNPPKLFIHGRFRGVVTVNRYLTNIIPTATFLYMLKKQLPQLLAGHLDVSVTEARKLQRESFIEAQDGIFLGNLNPNIFDNESIFNRFGMYGSQFSQESIFNRFCPYGNKLSQLSAYNEVATTPPKIYIRGQFFGYLTKNSSFSNRIDPDDILTWAKRNVSYELV